MKTKLLGCGPGSLAGDETLNCRPPTITIFQWRITALSLAQTTAYRSMQFTNHGVYSL